MVVAILGMTLTARVQIMMAAIEYGIVAVLLIIGLWDTFVSQPHGFVSPSWSWLSPSGVGGAGDLVGTLLLAVVLIAGWDASLYVNEETENSEVNPGRAVMISVVFLGLFYMLMFAFQAVAPASAIDAHAPQGLSFAADRVAGRAGDKAMSLAVLLSAVATTQIGFVTLSRVSYSMGRELLDGYGWAASTGQLHRRYRTLRSELRTGLGNLLLVGILPLAAAEFLGWIIVKSIAGFTQGENLTLLAILISGIAMLVIAQMKNSPFFDIPRAKHGEDMKTP